MKTYTTSHDPCFAWLTPTTEIKPTKVIVLRGGDHLLAVIPEDEATPFDTQNGTQESWYVLVAPLLCPRGWFESQIDKDEANISFSDYVHLKVKQEYKTHRFFVKTKAAYLRAARILTEINMQINNKDTTPKKFSVAKTPGNQYSIEEQVEMSTKRSHELDGNNPLPITDAFRKNFETNYDKEQKLDLKDIASPDFQTWLQKERTKGK